MGPKSTAIATRGLTPLEYRARFPVEPRAPGAARRLVRCLDDRVPASAVESLELLVTELVTNSIRHAGIGDDGWVGVEIVVDRDRIFVEVSDPGRGFDRHQEVRGGGEERGSGWGLYLVDQMAPRWGVHHDALTRVWFEMPTTPAFA